jgi:tRNA G46 methylase TrmB
VVVTAETDEQRRTRERQRGLFDGVAELYDATRQGYPAEIVDSIFTTAAIGQGTAAVLEIGCGTGQLTRELAGRALNQTFLAMALYNTGKACEAIQILLRVVAATNGDQHVRS